MSSFTNNTTWLIGIYVSLLTLMIPSCIVQVLVWWLHKTVIKRTVMSGLLIQQHFHSTRPSCCWRDDVGDRFKFGGFSLERCGRQVTIKKLAVGEMWVTGLSWGGSCWRIAGKRFWSGELSLKTCGLKVDWEGCCWRDVGDKFQSGEFSLERCGRKIPITGELTLERCRRQVPIGRVFVGEMWATGSDWEGCCWRIVGDRFRSWQFSLERCGRQIPIRRVNRFGLGRLLLENCGRQQVPIGRVFVGEMWATGSSSEGFHWRDVDDRFRSGELTLERCERKEMFWTDNVRQGWEVVCYNLSINQRPNKTNTYTNT
jgi:hypothetical protein